MKNYKIEEKLRFILENRVRLQSVQKYLEEYNIPNNNFEYFKSDDFINNYFMKWSAFQKKNFITKLVGGGDNWKQFKAILEKE